MTDISELDKYKQQLGLLLADITPDEALICGILNFVRGRIIPLIVKDINDSVKGYTANDDELQLAQSQNTNEKADELVNLMWSDFYHPVFRYYQAQHYALNKAEPKHKKKTVELRKLNAKFLKVSKMSRDFFFDLIKQVLTQYINFQIPHAVYEFLQLEIEENAIPIKRYDEKTIIKTLSVVYWSMLHIGATSRYRSSMSLFLAKEDHEDFEKAMEICRYAELLAPVIGEARNQIGMIYVAEDEPLNAAYEFLRSSLAIAPSKFGALNYKKLMANNAPLVEKLNRTKLENKCTKKNIRNYISIYFISILGFYTQSSWKREDGAMVNGMKVDQLEKELLRLVKQLATEQGDKSFFFEKLLLLLIGSVANIPKDQITELTLLLRFTFKYITALESIFIEQWVTDKKDSLLLLPTLRIMVTWLKNQKVALAYSHRTVEFIQTSTQLANLIYFEYPDDSFETRPKREQFFSEDVGVKAFAPLGQRLWDFDDDNEIFGDPSKSIGQFAEHDAEYENRLRLLAVGTMIRTLLCGREGVTFDQDTRELKVDLSKIVKKREPPVRSVGITPTSTNKKPTKKDEKEGKNGGKEKYSKNDKKKESSKKKSKKNKAKKQKIIEVSDSDTDSDVEQITEEVYHRHNDQISEKYKPLEQTPPVVSFSKPTQIVLEEKSSEQRMEKMVDSIVDEVHIVSDSSDEQTSPNIVQSQPHFESQPFPTSQYPQKRQFQSPQPQGPHSHFQSPQPRYPPEGQFQTPAQLPHQQFPQQFSQQAHAAYQNLYGGIWSQNDQFNAYYMYQQQLQQQQQQPFRPPQYPYHGRPPVQQVPTSLPLSQPYQHLYPYYGQSINSSDTTMATTTNAGSEKGE
jgi:telomere elongation protein